MLDEELIEEMKQELPEGIPSVFISSVSGLGITELKDLLWNELNKETFHEVERIVHKSLDLSTIPVDDDDEDFVYVDDEDEDDLEICDWDDDEEELSQ